VEGCYSGNLYVGGFFNTAGGIAQAGLASYKMGLPGTSEFCQRVLPVSITSGPSVNVAPHQITFTWKTSKASSTEVAWGPSSQGSWAGYPNTSTYTSMAGTNHSRTLTGLAPGTYYYRVRSYDGTSYATSSEGTFTVNAFDNQTPTDQLTF